MTDGEVLRRHRDGALEDAPFLHALLGALRAASALDAALEACAGSVPPAGPVAEPADPPEDPPALLALLGLLAVRSRVGEILEREASAGGGGAPSRDPVGVLPASPRELLR